MPVPFTDLDFSTFESNNQLTLSPGDRQVLEGVHQSTGLQITESFFASLATPEAMASAARQRPTIRSGFFARGPLELPFGTPGLAPPPIRGITPIPPVLVQAGVNIQISPRAVAALIPGIPVSLAPITPLDLLVGRTVAGGFRLPNISTGSFNFGDISAGLGTAIGALPGALLAAFAPQQQRGTFVGGSLPGGAVLSARDRPIPGPSGPTGDPLLLPEFVGGAGGFESGLFRPSRASATPQIFHVRNPVTNAETWFGPLGAPLLWTRDLMAVKKVKRLARRARRAGG